MWNLVTTGLNNSSENNRLIEECIPKTWGALFFCVKITNSIQGNSMNCDID